MFRHDALGADKALISLHIRATRAARCMPRVYFGGRREAAKAPAPGANCLIRNGIRPARGRWHG